MVDEVVKGERKCAFFSMRLAKSTERRPAESRFKNRGENAGKIKREKLREGRRKNLKGGGTGADFAFISS